MDVHARPCPSSRTRFVPAFRKVGERSAAHAAVSTSHSTRSIVALSVGPAPTEESPGRKLDQIP